jgi:ATP-dependent 26S proteasome regulatory subunit
MFFRLVNDHLICRSEIDEVTENEKNMTRMRNLNTQKLLYNCYVDEGASENLLRNSFSSLLSRGRASILVLDEVDMIASGRSSRKGKQGAIV